MPILDIPLHFSKVNIQGNFNANKVQTEYINFSDNNKLMCREQHHLQADY